MSDLKNQEGVIVAGQEFRVTIEVADLNRYMTDPLVLEFLDFAGENLAHLFNKNAMQLRLRDPINEGFVYGPND